MFLRRVIQVAAAAKNRQMVVPLLQRHLFVLPEISVSSKNYSKYIEDDDDEVPRFSSGRRQNFRNNSNRFEDDDDDFSRSRPESRQFKDYSRPNVRSNFSQHNQFQRRDTGYANNYGRNRSQNNSFTNAHLLTREWDEVELVEFKKDFYEPHPNTVNRSKEEVEEFRRKHEITASRGVPNPILSIDELNMPDYAISEFKKRNFTELTPIQAQGWPIVLSGKNLVGVAQTG